MRDEFGAGVLYGAIFSGFLFFLFGMAAGGCDGERKVRKEAVDAKAGYWSADEKTGQPIFVWGSK